MKVITKRFFDFPETYIYYTLCIYLLQKLKKNVQANFLMGLIFRTSWRVAPTKKKSLMGIWIFGILFTNVLELTGGYGCQFLQVFRLFFKGISFGKLTPPHFLSKILRFSEISLRGLFFVKLTPTLF